MTRPVIGDVREQTNYLTKPQGDAFYVNEPEFGDMVEATPPFVQLKSIAVTTPSTRNVDMGLHQIKN
ncbi:hypothetical protein NL526_27760, partial [Klebsiella pneumoniae]|nr:hypothetical protein [Klebsiella pneumoniae]